MRALLLASLVVSGCIVQNPAAPLVSGTGIQIDAATGTIAVDANSVPVVLKCASGQQLKRTATGWECFTPAQASELKAGDGIALSGDVVSAKFGAGMAEVARGDHNHDGLYRKVTDSIPWSS